MADWHLGGVHHLGLTVRDIEHSVQFYRDILGLRLLGRRTAEAGYIAKQTGVPGARLAVASFQLSPEGGPTLELAQYLAHEADNASTATDRPGTSHLCVTINDIHDAYQSLRSKGVRFKSEPIAIRAGPNEGGFAVYLYDPDGYTIELFQPPPVRERDPSSMELL